MSSSNSLRIGLDLRGLDPGFKEHAGRGTGRYVKELTSRLLQIEDDQLTFIPLDSQTLGLTHAQKKLLSGLPRGKVTFETQICFRKNIAKTNCNLVHFFSHGDAPAYPITPQACTILDLIPLRFPHLYKSGAMGLRFQLARFLENRAALASRGIIAISEATKRDIVDILNISPNKIAVTHLGVDEKFFQKEAPHKEGNTSIFSTYNLPKDKKYLLYVGGIDPRKNVPFLFDVLDSIQNASDTKVHLIIAGNISRDKSYPSFLEKLNRHNAKDLVHLLGFVPDEDLSHLLKLADAFVFPSLYEGFGLPILEAMASSLTVFAGNNSCVPEVMQTSGYLLPDNDSHTWSKEILDFLHAKDIGSETVSSNLDEAHSIAKSFTWDRCVEQTVTAYKAFWNDTAL